MKVSKEAMVGLWVAIELFLEADHEADYLAHKTQMDTIVAGLSGRSDCRFEVYADRGEWPAPVIRIWAIDRAWTPRAVHDALARGRAAHPDRHGAGRPADQLALPAAGDEEVVIKRLLEEFDRGQ